MSLWDSLTELDVQVYYYLKGDKKKFRRELRRAQTFRQFFWKRIHQFNGHRNGSCNKEESLRTQQSLCDQHRIVEFNRYIFQLRRMADQPTIDTDEVKEIIWEKIYPMFLSEQKTA